MRTSSQTLDGSGVDLIHQLRGLAPACVAVVFPVIDDAPTILRALRGGPRGYVLESAPSEQIAPRLREAAPEERDRGCFMIDRRQTASFE